jgi:hypothetical protein
MRDMMIGVDWVMSDFQVHGDRHPMSGPVGLLVH